MTGPEWMDRAVCAQLVAEGVDPEAWTGEPDHPDRDQAVAACHQCPVTTQCGHYGARSPWGVWAGRDHTPSPPKTGPTDQLIDTIEACRILGVTDATVNRYVQKGLLTVAATTPARGHRKQWYRRSDIETIAARNTKPPVTDDMIDTTEAARILGVSNRVVTRYAHNGQLPIATTTTRGGTPKQWYYRTHVDALTNKNPEVAS